MFVLECLPGKDDSITCVAYSPDGRWLASTSGFYPQPQSGTIRGEVKLWDLASRQVRMTLRNTRNFARSVAFSPDGARLAAGLGDRTVRLWDVETLDEQGVMRGHSRSVGALAFSPDGSELISGAGDRSGLGRSGEVYCWDTATATTQARIPEPNGVWALAYQPQGKAVIIGTATVKLWWLHRDEPEVLLPTKTVARALALSPDGGTLALTAGWSVKLYDMSVARARATLAGHKQIVTSLAFSPDGRTLASGSADGTVRFWDVAVGRERACFDWGMRNVQCVAFAPDGMTAAAGGKSPNNLVIWDLDEAAG